MLCAIGLMYLTLPYIVYRIYRVNSKSSHQKEKKKLLIILYHITVVANFLKYYLFSAWLWNYYLQHFNLKITCYFIKIWFFKVLITTTSI